MNPPPYGNDIGDGNGSARAVSQASRQGWLCPFYLSDPINNCPCMGFKLGRVADVKQHLERKHPEEAKKIKSKTGKKKTDKERWYDLWDDLFPGQTRPAVPYAGTELVELFGAFVTEYIGQQREQLLLVDGQTALMGCLVYVRVRSLDMKSGNVSGQGVTGVSEDQPRNTRVQDHPYQHLPPPASSFVPTMRSFEQPDSGLVSAGHCHGPAFRATIEPQVLSNVEANGQYWPFPANSDAYPPAPTHQPPLNRWAEIGLAHEDVGSWDARFDPISATHWEVLK